MIFMKEANLSMPTYEAGLIQSQAYRSLGGFLNACLQPFGISTPEWSLLGLLNLEDGLRPSTISEQLGVRPPVATSMIAQLEKKGHIKKVPDTKDKRAARVCLSESGQQLIIAVEKQLRPEMKRFLNDVSMEELKIYLKVLSQIAAKLK